MDRRAWLPLSLTGLRLLLGPAILAGAFAGEPARPWLVAGLLVGIGSDILDGIVARRLGVATPALRRFDTLTDLVFWLSVLSSAAVLDPTIARERAWQVGLLVGLEIACNAVGLVKFGREPCTHAWLAKAWALLLVAAFALLIGAGRAGALFTAAVTVGVLAELDVIAITLILPKWESDVPSAWHAWQIRQGRAIKRYSLLN